MSDPAVVNSVTHSGVEAAIAAANSIISSLESAAAISDNKKRNYVTDDDIVADKAEKKTTAAVQNIVKERTAMFKILVPQVIAGDKNKIYIIRLI